MLMNVILFFIGVGVSFAIYKLGKKKGEDGVWSEAQDAIEENTFDAYRAGYNAGKAESTEVYVSLGEEEKSKSKKSTKKVAKKKSK
jgi:hypothetical protein